MDIFHGITRKIERVESLGLVAEEVEGLKDRGLPTLVEPDKREDVVLWLRVEVEAKILNALEVSDLKERVLHPYHPIQMSMTDDRRAWKLRISYRLRCA